MRRLARGILCRTHIFVAPNFVFNDGNGHCVHVSLYTGRRGLTRTLREVGGVVWRGGVSSCKVEFGARQASKG